MSNRELDTSGFNCPIPIIKAKKELNKTESDKTDDQLDMDDLENDLQNVSESEEDVEIKLEAGISKKCSGCNEIKLFDDFCNRKPTKGKYADGKDYRCKVCSKKLTKKWKENNKDHVSSYNDKYRKENKEKIKLHKVFEIDLSNNYTRHETYQYPIYNAQHSVHHFD